MDCQMLTVLLVLHILYAAASAALPIALPGCQDKCGEVAIPYPFGIGSECARDSGFIITCNTSFTPPLPVLGSTNIDLLEIQLPLGLIRVNQIVANECHSESGINDSYANVWTDLSELPYKFSDSRNKFVGIGCDSKAYLLHKELMFMTGCSSMCNDISYVTNGTCAGIGCCEIPIPKGLGAFTVYAASDYSHSKCMDFSPCSYAFLVDDGWFKFSSTMFKEFNTRTNVPVTLDWVVSSLTCDEARKNLTSYACVAGQSICIDSANGPGYRCACWRGTKGILT